MEPGHNENKLKRLELLGGLGAGILGAGLALLFAEHIKQFAIPLLLLGIVSHGWTMFQKGRLELQAGIGQPRWADAAEWACWIMMAGLLVYIAYRMLT